MWLLSSWDQSLVVFILPEIRSSPDRHSPRCHMYITREQTGTALGIGTGTGTGNGHWEWDCDSSSDRVGLVRTVTGLVYLVSLQFTSAVR